MRLCWRRRAKPPGRSPPPPRVPDDTAAAPRPPQAATQPAQGPITVKWSGKLRVVPLESPPDPSLVPGKAVVQIIGSPVVLTREGTEAHAGAAFYNSANQSASLRSSASVPIVT